MSSSPLLTSFLNLLEPFDCLGYSGDVWFPQPAPKDHPWRYMPNQAMTPHISGTTIDAQVLLVSGYLLALSIYASDL